MRSSLQHNATFDLFLQPVAIELGKGVKQVFTQNVFSTHIAVEFHELVPHHHIEPAIDYHDAHCQQVGNYIGEIERSNF